MADRTLRGVGIGLFMERVNDLLHGKHIVLVNDPLGSFRSNEMYHLLFRNIDHIIYGALYAADEVNDLPMACCFHGVVLRYEYGLGFRDQERCSDIFSHHTRGIGVQNTASPRKRMYSPRNVLRPCTVGRYRVNVLSLCCSQEYEMTAGFSLH